MDGYHSTLTYNGAEVRVVSWHFREVNPYSMLRDFDMWFKFECYVHGLCERPTTVFVSMAT